jgi:hypothetical protein
MHDPEGTQGVTKVDRYWLGVDALTQPVQVREDAADHRR